MKKPTKENSMVKKISKKKSSKKSTLVMIRTYSAGVHFGELASRKGKEVVLKNAHRVFYWTNACSLSQLAMQGSQNKNTENKISMAVPEIILTEAIEIIPMTKESFDNLTAIIWKK